MQLFTQFQGLCLYDEASTGRPNAETLHNGNPNHSTQYVVSGWHLSVNGGLSKQQLTSEHASFTAQFQYQQSSLGAFSVAKQTLVLFVQWRKQTLVLFVQWRKQAGQSPDQQCDSAGNTGRYALNTHAINRCPWQQQRH